MGDLVKVGVHDESSSRYWEREAAFHRTRANQLQTKVLELEAELLHAYAGMGL